MSWTITPRFTQWTPADISTALWLDAADATTVMTVSGAVSQWNDKSGNGRNATQSTAGQRPAYNETINSKNVITFDGIDDTLNTASFTFSTTNLASCCVFRTTDIAEEGIWGGQNSSSNRLGLFFTGGSALRSHSNDDGSADVSGYSANNTVLVSFSRNSTLAKQFRNGSQVSSVTYAVQSAAAMPISVGSFANNNVGSFPGQFGELIVFVDDDFNRQKTEGYLAHKWGLTANLPSDHPYKVNPPAP
jgi:hypothetical protein